MNLGSSERPIGLKVVSADTEYSAEYSAEYLPCNWAKIALIFEHTDAKIDIRFLI